MQSHRKLNIFIIDSAMSVETNGGLFVCFVFFACGVMVIAMSSEGGSSKSATIEMYAPSSYNETVNGETLSSISEKSEAYSQNGSHSDYAVS